MKRLTKWHRSFSGISLNLKECLVLYKAIGKFSKNYAINALSLTEDEFKILTEIWDELNEEFENENR